MPYTLRQWVSVAFNLNTESLIWIDLDSSEVTIISLYFHNTNTILTVLLKIP